MKEPTKAEKEKWIQEEMDRVSKNVFALGVQMTMYSNLAGAGKTIKQQYLNVVGQIKTQIEENGQYFEQLERESKKI